MHDQSLVDGQCLMLCESWLCNVISTPVSLLTNAPVFPYRGQAKCDHHSKQYYSGTTFMLCTLSSCPTALQPELLRSALPFLRLQVDLRLEAENLWQFNLNFKKQAAVCFPVPIYPLVAPEVLVETFQEGDSISRCRTSLLLNMQLNMWFCGTGFQEACWSLVA